MNPTDYNKLNGFSVDNNIKFSTWTLGTHGRNFLFETLP